MISRLLTSSGVNTLRVCEVVIDDSSEILNMVTLPRSCCLPWRRQQPRTVVVAHESKICLLMINFDDDRNFVHPNAGKRIDIKLRE
jgi:hypothetical protein